MITLLHDRALFIFIQIVQDFIST